ncbi:YigZ family protein [Malaciobacter molluscorum]|uniref:YigZ family protein n=1 Tax=Malaciobacter molluscorum TaxID=1032072 RepID=UPI00100A549C|nr:YigZ family protein [Malaciobacter molluscorum]RXJ91936.1 YigZ family protein [Malaciobacter molluscorum]
MNFVKENFSSIFEEKKSKFIAYLFPISKFDDVMKSLKEEHPKARHHVYAYRYLNEFDQIVENSSDDGEPKGTSGKPSLNVLSGHDLINTAVIIVRYFGGVKLGTGGLVRAYSDAVNKVIDTAILFKYEKILFKTIICEYSELSKIEYDLQQLDIQIKNKFFSQHVLLELESTKEKFQKLNEILPRHIKIK